MYLFKEKEALQKFLLKLRSEKKTVGYVPTMGALHKGHLRLIEQAVQENPMVIVTIFVNPTQFNEKQDFDQYPIQIEKDILALEKAGTTILYFPEVKEIYPEGMENLEHFDFGELEKIAEGLHRPGHFQGVGQVLSRFLKILQPDNMYMGQKDYQQLLITRKLTALLALNVKIIGVPIVREEDGLAMSSRNARLSEAGRKTASVIFDCLKYIQQNKEKYPLDRLLEKGRRRMEDSGLKVEYLTLANAENLQQEESFSTHPQILIVAAWLEDIRLIDNMLL